MSNRSYPKECWCTGSCTHSVEGQFGSVIQNPNYIGDEIGGIIIRNGGLETNYIYKDPFALGMAGLLFDIESETYPDWTTRMVYKLKSGLGSSSAMKPVQISRRNNCCAVVWYEGTALNTTTSLVAAGAIGDTTIELVDGTVIGGISTPMSLVIKDDVNGKRITVTVVDVDAGNPNLLTLKAPLTVAIDASACVMRGHYNPAAGCKNTYSNTVSFSNNDKEYVSYFTRIIHTLDFDSKCVINQTYLSDLLKGDEGAKESAAYRILQSSFSAQLSEAMNQFVRSAFFHKNKCGDGEEYGETYGLLEAMKTVHESGVPQFFDLSECCDPEECEAINAENLIKTFLKIVQSRAQLSIYSETKRVIVAINEDMLESLMDLRKHFEMFTGEVRTIEQGAANSDDIITTRRKTFQIEDRGYTIVFIHEPLLNEIPNEFALIMPENTMGVFTFKNDVVELGDGGVQIIQNNQQLVSGDTLKFKMMKDERTNNHIDGCTSFNMWLYYSIVWTFVDKCAYWAISNMRLCSDESECHDCVIDPAQVPFC